MPFLQHSVIALMKLNPNQSVMAYENDDVNNVIQGDGHSGLISKEEANILVGAKAKVEIPLLRQLILLNVGYSAIDSHVREDSTCDWLVSIPHVENDSTRYSTLPSNL